jgi:tetratricopeptide (TPR) repeat protein
VLSLQGEALCRLDRAPEAFEKLSPLLERSPGLRTSFWLPAAADLVQQEASARAWIERVRPLLDRSSETDVIALASAYAGVGRRFDTMRVAMFEQAQKTLASFVEQKGESSPRVLECLGFVYQGLGKNAEAGVAYRQAIEKQPKSIFAIRGLAELSLADKPAEALTFARRALEIGGDRDTQSKSLLGTALLTTSARKRDANDVAGAVSDANEAVGIFDSLLAGQPGNALIMMQAIAALDAADRQKETVPRYEELTKLPRASLPAGITGPMLLNNLAYALLRTGATGPELVRAQGLAKQAPEQLPSAATFDTLGHIELARNDKKGAISAFRTAIERDDKSFSSMVGLAEAYLMSPSPQDEIEARRLLDELDKKGAAVPTALQDQVAGLRRRLP